MRTSRLAALLAFAALVVNSLDCYGAWITSKQARECCSSGHCSSAKPDPCCHTAPSASHPNFISQQKVDNHPLFVTLALVSPSPVPLLSAVFLRQFQIGSDIPPPLESRALSLPLLI